MSSEGEQEKEGEELKLLSEAIKDPALRSSVRLLILISLALNGHLSFTDLLSLTGLGKGSLSNHIEKLEESGLVQAKLVRTFRGYRMVVSITPKGLETYRELMKLFKKVSEK